MDIGVAFTWARCKAHSSNTLRKLSLQNRPRTKASNWEGSLPGERGGSFKRAYRGDEGRLIRQRCFLAKVLPDPDLRYFSNANARSSSVNAT